MMNTHCTLKMIALALIVSFSAYGQTGEISIINPLLRVGDEISVNVLISDAESSIVRGQLSLKKMCLDTGWVDVGPLKIEVQNISYETNALKLKVMAPLPPEKTTGLWMSLVEVNSGQYLVLEQRIGRNVEWKSKSKNELVIRTDSDQSGFAELNEARLKEAGIEVVSSSTRSGDAWVDIFNKNGAYNYKVSTYELKKLPEFKRAVKLDKTFFTGFPEKMESKELWIR
ncbi:hypothetical protein [Chryseolinea soli]|nr:hypothetical protein [Chryseolinea soli]